LLQAVAFKKPDHLTLQVDPENDLYSEEVEDNIDRLLNIESKSGPSKPLKLIASSSDSSNKDTIIDTGAL